MRKKPRGRGPAEREALRAGAVLEDLRRQVRKPMCPLRLTLDPCTPFDSHIGGLPYCPRDAALPLGAGGEPLRLLAQLNFAQMAPMPPFPDRGILQFFQDDRDPLLGYRGMERWTDQAHWRVLYHPDPDPSVTEAEVRAKLHPGGTDNGGPPSYVFLNLRKPCKLHFLPPEEEGVTIGDCRFWPLFHGLWQERFPKDPLDCFWPQRPWKREEGPRPLDHIWADEVWRELWSLAGGVGSKLGGFPAFPRTDPRPARPEPGCPWDTVLFQLASVCVDLENPRRFYSPADFGYGGWPVFLIREEDLRRRDFTRVGYYWHENSDDPCYKELCGPGWKPSRRLGLTP